MMSCVDGSRVARVFVTVDVLVGCGLVSGLFARCMIAGPGLPGEWREWVARRHRCFDPLFDPYCTRHTFGTWYRYVHKDRQNLRDEIGWTTTRMGERYRKKMSRVYAPEIQAWWDDEVDLGLAEVEEVSRKNPCKAWHRRSEAAPESPMKSDG
jgi:hypothetical protein